MQRKDSAKRVGSSCDGGSWETHKALASVPTSPVECSNRRVDHDNHNVAK